jgi:hypothetical protein
MQDLSLHAALEQAKAQLEQSQTQLRQLQIRQQFSMGSLEQQQEEGGPPSPVAGEAACLGPGASSTFSWLPV